MWRVRTAGGMGSDRRRERERESESEREREARTRKESSLQAQKERSRAGTYLGMQISVFMRPPCAGDTLRVARGGRGGRGNAAFKTARDTTPRRATRTPTLWHIHIHTH
eukprot:5467659-Pleurochrysis_carterae.AAC.1